MSWPKGRCRPIGGERWTPGWPPIRSIRRRCVRLACCGRRWGSCRQSSGRRYNRRWRR
ncbi:hypothetical protein M5585_26365 [Serratia ureilytica]